METRYGFNEEGYKDPTATKAVKNVTKSTFGYRPVVYVCSRYAGDTSSNVMAARRYCRFAVDNGVIPVAPHLFFPQFMSDETEHELAMYMNKILLSKCREIWVFGDGLSDGMKAEVAYAKKLRKKIRYFDSICSEKTAGD